MAHFEHNVRETSTMVVTVQNGQRAILGESYKAIAVRVRHKVNRTVTDC